MTVAGSLKKGEREIAFRASYVDLNMGAANGFGIGRQQNIDLSALCGWLLTDANEFGVMVAYTRQETTGYAFYPDRAVDGPKVGIFYDYNFRTGGFTSPYVGVGASAIGGDIGDLYGEQYEAEVGVKIYPWDHAGFALAADYSILRSKSRFLPNATQLALSAAIAVRF